MTSEAELEALRRTVARLERRIASDERAFERLDKMLVASDSVSSNLLREQARFLEEREEKNQALQAAREELLENLIQLRDREQALQLALDRIHDDLAESRTFQQALLPALPEHPRMSMAAAYRPADEVGGDLYDVTLHGDRLRIFVGDTTGHGVQAALRTIVVRSLLERHRDAPSPAALLAALNRELVAAHGKLVRLSACCVELELASSRLTYANAGAPPVFLFREDQTCEELYLAGSFLGVVEETAWSERTLELPRNARLFLYTDGLFDQWNRIGEPLPEARVTSALSLRIGITDAVQAALKAGAEFRGDIAQQDDIALIGVALSS